MDKKWIIYFSDRPCKSIWAKSIKEVMEIYPFAIRVDEAY